jgi:penicillin-binding protein 1A
VTLPEWQLEPDEEAYFGNADEVEQLDENGQPILPEPGAAVPVPESNPDVEAPQKFDQKWIDGVLGREQGAPPPVKPLATPKPSTPPPKPAPAADQSFPRPNQ